jgi:hypothetical protein
MDLRPMPTVNPGRHHPAVNFNLFSPQGACLLLESNSAYINEVRREQCRYNARYIL